MTALLEGLERATAFIRSIAGTSIAGGLGLSHHFQALFGLWIAESAQLAPDSSWIGEATVSTRDAVARERERGSFDPYAYDPKLLVLCHAAMLERDIESAPLAGFRREIAAGLRGMDIIPPRLAGLALLLEALGEPVIGTAEAVFPRGDDAFLRADATGIRNACNQIAAASLFGARRPPAEHAAGFLRTMPIVLLQKLRDYDLVLGATLLRTLKYLGAPRDEDIRHATDYLMCQQQRDGRFGYYARELSGGPALRHAGCQLYLPVTVTVLWALVETWVPEFSVVQRADAGSKCRL